MNSKKLSCTASLAASILLIASCGGGQDSGTAYTAFSVFAPATVNEIADASELRVRGIVRSEPRTYEIPQEPAPPGADGSPRAQIFSYEVVDVEVQQVLGPKSDALQKGQAIPVGVAVVTASETDVIVSTRDEAIPPDDTFTAGVGAEGVFFLTNPRSLGTYGEGYELVGFAQNSAKNADRAVIKGVAGPFRGESVPRQNVNNAAERSKPY